MMIPCALVPTCNHWRALPDVVAALRGNGLPVIIIDDGSGPQAAAAIAALHDPESGVQVHRRPHNGGKGAAVIDGFRLAAAQGFTHAVQVDADGQHDPAALPLLLAAAHSHPGAVVSGQPQYDASAPLGRRIGRWITHVWVFVETLSLRITDSMCGFRVYPLAPCLELLEHEQVGLRMDFDTEIMVRLFWRGVPPLMVPVRVVYPADNTSNFRMWADNVRISVMHTRLVLGMLWRLPSILRRRPPATTGRAADHWAGMAERGALWGLAFVAAAYRLLGRAGCAWVMAPIVFYFFLTGRRQRQASRDYLGRVLKRQPSALDSWRHYRNFAGRALDAFAAWSGAVPRAALDIADPQALAQAAGDPRGALLVVSHHGNAELSQALMDPALRRRLTVLVHTRHAENYNRLLAVHRGEAAARMLQVTEIGPDTAIMLRQRIEAGEWIAMAGDRVPVLSRGRVSRVPFLGGLAEFSHGPWVLAALLGCPVLLLFCRQVAGDRWRLSVEPFAERVDLPRGHRAAALDQWAGRYAERLERECREAPLQWYNFYDFWAEGEAP
ncbi:MAG: glycosyltransferase family 2 protein [Magnetospirillum gryphiswaldense]|nr:glycosyltransferase family 2 protein [Magnetospirillum gryphiswaldense]